MNDKNLMESGKMLWSTWEEGRKITGLPDRYKPKSKLEAYTIQQNVSRVSGSKQIGWKIAATSQAGQEHIGVNGPLAGSILESQIKKTNEEVSLDNNIMKVAELEFGFKMGKDLPKTANDYSKDDVLNAIDYLIPTIEIPDSRYLDFIKAGETQLIADNACAGWLFLGEPYREKITSRTNLIDHKVTALTDHNHEPTTGIGSNVLGDPLVALTWLANELLKYGRFLAKGDLVSTGTCVTPISISNTKEIKADFGLYGKVTAKFSD